MEIHIAATETEIDACYPVMQQLRPHIAKDQFLSRIRRQEDSGYRLAYLLEADKTVAIAGFRICENLAWGRFLYVDDLVTLSERRSRGYGAKLLSWLTEKAREEECAQVHLDSGIQRKDAHRFYERQGMTLECVHFAKKVKP